MSEDTLSSRQRQILVALCRQHVVTGRPVASAALVHMGLEWSSATIRNELGALERSGFVHKPHSASGRVPTAAGWRIYVASLPRGDARPEHQRLVDVSLGDGGDPRVGLRSTARVLSELSGCVAIGFVGELRTGVIRALELVPLTTGSEDSGRVLVMIGRDDGSSSVRTVEVERELLSTDGQLRRLQDLLRELTVGRSLEQARQQLQAHLDAHERRVDRLVAEALRIGMLLCVASFEPLFMQVAGQGALIGSLLGGDAGEQLPAGEILALLEDYQRVAEILCQLLPDGHADPRASVRVDLDLGAPADLALGGGGSRVQGLSEPDREARLSGLTLVGCRLRWLDRSAGPPHANTRSAGATGAVALLGSPRMDYEAVIPLVEYAARAMAARG